MSLVFGLAGVSGSGKTELAGMLHDLSGGHRAHLEYSTEVIGLANGWLERIGEVACVATDELAVLQDIASKYYGRPVSNQAMSQMAPHELLPYLSDRQNMSAAARLITAGNRDSHRLLLQWLGEKTTLHVDPDFWSQVIKTSIEQFKDEGASLITTGGVRYDPNAEMIHSVGGSVVEVIRPGHSGKLPGHVSEAGLSRHLIDAVVTNDGSLEDLRGKAQLLWQDVLQNQLARQY